MATGEDNAEAEEALLCCPRRLGHQACSGEQLPCCLASPPRGDCCSKWHSKGTLAALGARTGSEEIGCAKEAPQRQCMVTTSPRWSQVKYHPRVHSPGHVCEPRRGDRATGHSMRWTSHGRSLFLAASRRGQMCWKGHGVWNLRTWFEVLALEHPPW